MQKFSLEFILSASNASAEMILHSLMQAGEGAKVLEIPQRQEPQTESFQVQVSTQDPTLIFDICSQFGRIRSIRIDEKKAK